MKAPGHSKEVFVVSKANVIIQFEVFAVSKVNDLIQFKSKDSQYVGSSWSQQRTLCSI